jgi:hypothetical protein
MTPPGATLKTSDASSGPLARDPRLRQDLQATLAAHKDLGPRYESELIDSFLNRLDRDIDVRIDQRLARRRRGPRSMFSAVVALAVSLLLAIPLVAVAGGIAGNNAILAVLILIGFLNVYYDLRRR